MNKFFLILLFSVWNYNLKSQIAFCPAGAVWHYFYWLSGSFSPQIPTFNVEIVYTGDTIINNETVKILKSKDQNYVDRYTEPSKGSCTAPLVSKTFIKQRGDTVFFNNGLTFHGWQILYNFATPPGGSWVTHFNSSWPSGMGYPNATPDYTVKVDSVRTVIINTISLKRLYTTLGVMTQRLGADYLFYFPSASCGGANFNHFLCYEDIEMGHYKATENPVIICFRVMA